MHSSYLPSGFPCFPNCIRLCQTRTKKMNLHSPSPWGWSGWQSCLVQPSSTGGGWRFSQCVGNEARVLVELVKHQEVSWQIPLWKGNMDQKNNILVGDVGESPKVQKMVRFSRRLITDPLVDVSANGTINSMMKGSYSAKLIHGIMYIGNTAFVALRWNHPTSKKNPVL